MDTQGYPRQLMTMMQERIFSRSGKCHSTIKSKNAHMRVCVIQMTVNSDNNTKVSVNESDNKNELDEEVLTASSNIVKTLSAFYGK